MGDIHIGHAIGYSAEVFFTPDAPLEKLQPEQERDDFRADRCARPTKSATAWTLIPSACRRLIQAKLNQSR